MTNIRAVVVDDEPLSRRVLRQLAMHHADLQIVRECRDGIEAIDALREVAPDVVFLDVRMPGASGLDVVRGSRPGAGPQFIFVTAFDRFAVPAFDVAATDYLLKPVTQERFDLALTRVRERMQVAAKGPARIAPADRHLRHDRVIVPVDGSDIVLSADAIECITAENVYAILHTDGGTYRFRSTLARLARQLDSRQFFRVHRSFLVRLDRVRAIRRGAASEMLVLASGRRVPVGRRRRRALERALAAHATVLGPATDRLPRPMDRSQQID